MLTSSGALQQLATDMGRASSSSSIMLVAISADEKHLTILFSSYHWHKLVFVLSSRSKFSIHHSWDKHSSPPYPLYQLNVLQVHPCCDTNFAVSHRYLRAKIPRCLKYALSIPYSFYFPSLCFLPTFFFLPSVVPVIFQQCPITISPSLP